VIRLAHEGDAGCRRVLADAGRHVGVAMANMYNLLDPELIVLGGNLAPAGAILIDPLRESMVPAPSTPARPYPRSSPANSTRHVVVVVGAAAGGAPRLRRSSPCHCWRSANHIRERHIGPPVPM
jgi:predicted NBD/HSP70 family sugar kinase